MTTRKFDRRILAPINRHAIHGDDSDEHQHQAALISWIHDTTELQTDPIKAEALYWFHAIPNAGAGRRGFLTKKGKWLPPLQAVRMKAEGVKAGISDLRLDYVVRDPGNMDRIICPGLVAEMKQRGESLSPEQRRYQEYMKSQGFETHKWITWQQGAQAIVKFMNLERIGTVFYKEGEHVMRVTDVRLLRQAA